MADPFAKKRYRTGQIVECVGCLSQDYRADVADNGSFVCLRCGFTNEYVMDSFPDTDVKLVLRNASEMAGHRRRDGKISV